MLNLFCKSVASVRYGFVGLVQVSGHHSLKHFHIQMTVKSDTLWTKKKEEERKQKQLKSTHGLSRVNGCIPTS